MAELVGRDAPELSWSTTTTSTYCKIRLDERSLATRARHLGDIADPLARALVLGRCWDMTRDAEMPARDFVAWCSPAPPRDRLHSCCGSLLAPAVRTYRHDVHRT